MLILVLLPALLAGPATHSGNGIPGFVPDSPANALRFLARAYETRSVDAFASLYTADYRRVGSRCPVHRGTFLAADTVVISQGLRVISPRLRTFLATEPDSFPLARLEWDGGCVITNEIFTEVAYCSECRAAFERGQPKRR